MKLEPTILPETRRELEKLITDNFTKEVLEFPINQQAQELIFSVITSIPFDEEKAAVALHAWYPGANTDRNLNLLRNLHNYYN